MPGKRILIVDRQEGMVKQLACLLRNYGCQIICANDAVSAIRTVRRARPDLILVDIGSQGDDGLRVIQRLASMNTTSPTPIIAITSAAPAAATETQMLPGAATFLEMPVHGDELVSSIRQVLGHGAAT